MFGKKYIHIINKIGSKDNENEGLDGEITFEEPKWAQEYCDSFMFNLRAGRFNKSK
jgi:hypothetical protein